MELSTPLLELISKESPDFYPRRQQSTQRHTTDISGSFSIGISSFPSDDDLTSSHKWHRKPTNWIRLFVIIILIIILVIGMLFSDVALTYCSLFLRWMDRNPLKGSFAFVALYILCSVIMIPGSILTLGAGFVYVRMFGNIEGLILASTVVWFGASIGATMAFINGRYLFRNLVEHYLSKSHKFALIDSVVGMNGFKVTFLLRLSPVTPYNVFNYLMGITSVKIVDYMLACIGMIPDCIVFCFIGGSIASIAKLGSVGFTSSPFLMTTTVVGSAAAVSGVVYISYLAKKEFNKMASQSSISFERENSENDKTNDIDPTVLT